MKIKLVLVLSICFFSLCNAQVGVNTESPEGALHIKGTTGTNNDVVVSDKAGKEGNVGIGTTNPSEKLHVVGDVNISGNSYSNSAVVTENTFVGGKTSLGGNVSTSSVKLEVNTGSFTTGMKLEGGPELANKVFVSDALGIASLRNFKADWAMKEGTVYSGNSYIVSSTNAGSSTIDNNFKPISNEITLEKGKWLILAKCIIYQPATATTYGFHDRAGKMRLIENGSSIINEASAISQRRAHRFASPEIVQFVHITSGQKTYKLTAFIDTTNNDLTGDSGRGCIVSDNTILGKQYFVAVRLDDE